MLKSLHDESYRKDAVTAVAFQGRNEVAASEVLAK